MAAVKFAIGSRQVPKKKGNFDLRLDGDMRFKETETGRDRGGLGSNSYGDGERLSYVIRLKTRGRAAPL